MISGKTGWLVVLLSLMCLFTGCGGSAETSETEETAETKQIFAMDTVMTITAYGEKAGEALSAAEQEIERLDGLFSVGEDTSDIAVLNRDKKAVVSEDTLYLLQRSRELWESTEGALNIGIYPLMEAWGFTTGEYRIPEESEIAALLQHLDIEEIRWDSETREVTIPETMGVDLGAIAKGYTSGRLMDIFAARGVTSAVVSLGGNVQALGTKPDGSSWRVAIEDPFESEDSSYAGILEIADKAVITSGAYERYFEENGKRYHHILDPSTGYPAENGLASVTIVSAAGTLADGLSTALFVMGKEGAEAYWQAHGEDFDMILIEEDGTMTVTEGIKDSFTSDWAYSVLEKNT